MLGLARRLIRTESRPAAMPTGRKSGNLDQCSTNVRLMDGWPMALAVGDTHRAGAAEFLEVSRNYPRSRPSKQAGERDV